jgi:hypothetical protein
MRPANKTFLPNPSIDPRIDVAGGNTRITSVQNPPLDTSVVNDADDPNVTLKRHRWRSALRTCRIEISSVPFP